MKKIIFLVLISSMFNCLVLAQTNVSGGEVSGTWTKTNSPYLIQAAIMIANDSTLTIEPGVSAIFQGGYKFLVLGRLLAVGTETDSITFTAADTTTGWQGIQFDNTPASNDTSRLFYCKLTYGRLAYGGSLYYFNFSKAIISNSRISNNYADAGGNGRGGGIYCYGSSPTISNNTILNNSSSWGGGIYCENSSPTIFNNTISNNSAATGGGIYCINSSSLISNNTISNNSTWYDFGGGGIYCSSSPTISNNTISNNSAYSGGSGGGILCFEGNPMISNNTISNNFADSTGGGICCWINSSNIFNNTISNNKAKKGGALIFIESSPNLSNTILWGNNATTLGNQVYLEDESSDPNFYYCDVQGGKAGFSLNINVFYLGTYTNNMDADPFFVSPSAGSGTTYDGVNADWTLQSNSLCINAGDSSGNYPSNDKAGNPRICDGRIDMGAFEYQKSPCIIVTGNDAMDKSSKEISIFPNPTHTVFYLDIKNINDEKIEITLINVLGKEIIKMNYNDINTERFIKGIDMNGLAEQIYFVKVKINEQVYLRKISKIK